MRQPATSTTSASLVRAARLRLLLALLGALTSGCASLSRPPPDLDLGQAEIWPDPTAPALSVDGYSSKTTALGVGAAIGGGIGAVVAPVACLGTGVFAPMCVATVLPPSIMIGAVGGGVVAGVDAEDAEAVALKRTLLQSDLPAGTYPSLLATHLQGAAHARVVADLPLADPAVPATATSTDGTDAARSAAARPWRIELALTKVACEHNKPGQPYALRLEARMRLHHTGQPGVVYEKTLVARSEAVLTTAEWRTDGAAAARSSLDQGLQRLAEDMLNDLVRRPPQSPRAAPESPR